MNRVIGIALRLVSAGLLLTSSCALEGCAAEKVQAPFDTFVCYDTTFDGCLKTAQAGQLKLFHDNAYQAAYGKAGAGNFDDDPDAGKTVATSDAAYTCVYGSIPYTMNLKRDQQAPAVFVSPLLLRSLGEEHIKLQQIREACARLVQSYNYQMTVIKQQNSLATLQKAQERLAREITTEEYNRDSVGERIVSASEQQICAGGGAARDCLASVTDQIYDTSEKLRPMYITQLTTVDYAKQFKDANRAINLQLRELARQLFVLDRSLADVTAGGHPDHRGYEDGSWVRQGTVILSQ